jgi:hypothetical protein
MSEGSAEHSLRILGSLRRNSTTTAKHAGPSAATSTVLGEPRTRMGRTCPTGDGRHEGALTHQREACCPADRTTGVPNR